MEFRKRFFESTKFENSVAVATFTSEEIPRTFSTNPFGKPVIDPVAASYCLGDVILCNDYRDNEGGSFYGMGYVYFVNDYGSMGTSYAGRYFNSAHGGGRGGTSGGGTNTNTDIPDLSDDAPPSC